jgi:hypothetical protein
VGEPLEISTERPPRNSWRERPIRTGMSGDFERTNQTTNQTNHQAMPTVAEPDELGIDARTKFTSGGRIPPVANGVVLASPPTASERAFDENAAAQTADYYQPDAVQRRQYEREFRKHWNAASEDTAKPKEGDPFGGGHGQKATIDGKQLGQGGFGARLLDGSEKAAHDHAGEWGHIATPVMPHVEGLKRGYDQQLAFIDAHAEGHEMHWIEEEKKYSRAWAVENMQSIERYKIGQLRWAQSHNDWVPIANTAHRAQAELVESASLMGYDTTKDKDSAAFILGLEASLDMANQLVDAKVLGAGKAQSWSTRQDDATATSRAQPILKNEEVTPKLEALTLAHRELQTAHLEVTRALLEDRQDALAGEEGKITHEVEEIEKTIEFWTSLAETGQTMHGYAKKGEKYAKKVEKWQGGDGHRNANKELKQAKKDAQKAERDPTDYRSDLNSHAHHGNFEDHYDTWGPGGAEKERAGRAWRDPDDIHVEGTDPVETPEIPEAPKELSIGGIVKLGLNLLNKSKLEELKRKLANVRSRQAEAKHTAKKLRAEKAAEEFTNALARFEAEMKKVGEVSMRKREHDFVAFGHELDSYAVEHAADLQKQHAGHLIPGPAREIFATAMACLAKIEKFRATSKLALSMFPFNRMIHESRAEAAERSGQIAPQESAARRGGNSVPPPPHVPGMSKEEGEVYRHIAGGYVRVLEVDEHWSVRLEGVAARFRALMAKVEEGAAHPAEGRQF